MLRVRINHKYTFCTIIFLSIFVGFSLFSGEEGFEITNDMAALVDQWNKQYDQAKEKGLEGGLYFGPSTGQPGNSADAGSSSKQPSVLVGSDDAQPVSQGGDNVGVGPLMHPSWFIAAQSTSRVGLGGDHDDEGFEEAREGGESDSCDEGNDGSDDFLAGGAHPFDQVGGACLPDQNENDEGYGRQNLMSQRECDRNTINEQCVKINGLQRLKDKSDEELQESRMQNRRQADELMQERQKVSRLKAELAQYRGALERVNGTVDSQRSQIIQQDADLKASNMLKEELCNEKSDQQKTIEDLKEKIKQLQLQKNIGLGVIGSGAVLLAGCGLYKFVIKEWLKRRRQEEDSACKATN